MSLLRDIQDAAIDPNFDVSFLLRKCKVLAARLGNPEFNKWVDQELNGYKDIDNLPDYRIVHVYSKGHFAGPAGSGLRNADIPLSAIDKKFRKQLEKSYCMEPISSFVDLLKNPEGKSFQEAWPPDLVAHVGTNIYKYLNCLKAWKEIPRGAIVGLVDVVRNRILNFVLEIEAEAPDAGEAQPKTPPLSQERVKQVFHTHIYGNVGNIAEGSQHVSQTATLTVKKNDFNSLQSYLESLNIPNDKIIELKIAINKDSTAKVKRTKNLGPKVSAWLGSVFSGIAQGIIPVIQNVNTNLITQALLSYYGLQ